MDFYEKFAVFVVISVILMIVTLVVFLFVSGVQRPWEFFSRVRFPMDNSIVLGIIVIVAILIFGMIFYLKERVLKYG
jgi:hypothetical protein